MIENRDVAETGERDHVDRLLDEFVSELPEVDLEVEGIADRIGSLNRRIRRMLDETLADFGLTLSEWKILKLLRQAGPPFRRSAGRLADGVELTSGAMTARLDGLEKAGFVRRLPDPADRRGVQVELTPAGRRAWDDSFSAQAAKEALIAAALDENEKRQLNALLRRLMLEFERREQTRS